MDLKFFTEKLLAGRDFTASETQRLFATVFSENQDESELVCLLLAWSKKGEAGCEIKAACEFLRAHLLPIRSPAGAIDTCGTGGDGRATFNISTAAAIVAAAAGAKVAKHGNRAITSRSGSADFLEALGVRLLADPHAEERCLHEIGLCFLFAPHHHPLFKKIAAARKRAGVKTIFNLLGPLLNPAGVDLHLIGVYDHAKHSAMAEALKGPKTKAWLVTGSDGLDEITLTGPTFLTVVEGFAVSEKIIEPKDVGLTCAHLEDLAGGSAAENAALFRLMLKGKSSPLADCVLFNAAAALAISLDLSLEEGLRRARSALTGGQAEQLLQRLVAF